MYKPPREESGLRERGKERGRQGERQGGRETEGETGRERRGKVDLVLLDGGIVFVTHGADVHAPLPLSVPLQEELLHDALCPAAVQLQGLGGVTEVCTVHHVLEDLHTHTHMQVHIHKHTRSSVDYPSLVREVRGRNQQVMFVGVATWMRSE